MQLLTSEVGAVCDRGPYGPIRQRWVLVADLVLRESSGEAVKDDTHRDPGSPDASLTVDDCRVGLDEVERVVCHPSMVARQRLRGVDFVTGRRKSSGASLTAWGLHGGTPLSARKDADERAQQRLNVCNIATSAGRWADLALQDPSTCWGRYRP